MDANGSTIEHTRVYRNGKLEAKGFPIAEVSDYLAQDDTMVWIDVCAPSKDDLLQLAGELGLHELAVEDALSEHQRPKLDRYESHLFLSSHAVRVDLQAGELHKTEIDTFIGDRWIMTVRKDEGFSMQPVLARWDRSPRLAANGISYLLYGLLDVIVDDYFVAIQSFDDFYDEVSERIFSERPLDTEQQRQWFRMRQALVKFHRLVVPMREAVTGLMRREADVVADPLYPYFQDVYDHLIRVVEGTDALRDLVSTIVETNLSLRDYRQNQSMKKVTSWAAIIAVPTLVTGYYGMNVPYPGAGTTWGVWLSAVLVVSLSAALYVSFRKRDWL
jgi:magnesium transporter